MAHLNSHKRSVMLRALLASSQAAVDAARAEAEAEFRKANEAYLRHNYNGVAGDTYAKYPELFRTNPDYYATADECFRGLKKFSPSENSTLHAAMQKLRATKADLNARRNTFKQVLDSVRTTGGLLKQYPEAAELIKSLGLDAAPVNRAAPVAVNVDLVHAFRQAAKPT